MSLFLLFYTRANICNGERERVGGKNDFQCNKYTPA